MTTLDEAIAHELEIAKQKKEEYLRIRDFPYVYGDTIMRCKLCAEEHEQLAEWLEAYKQLSIETEQNIYERAYFEGQNKGISDGRFFGYIKAVDTFSHELKEAFNNEFPSNYSCEQTFFSLEDVRTLVEKTVEQIKASCLDKAKENDEPER